MIVYSPKTFNINLVITVIVANNIKQAEINIMRFNLIRGKIDNWNNDT